MSLSSLLNCRKDTILSHALQGTNYCPNFGSGTDMVGKLILPELVNEASRLMHANVSECTMNLTLGLHVKLLMINMTSCVITNNPKICHLSNKSSNQISTYLTLKPTNFPRESGVKLVTRLVYVMFMC